MTRIEHTTNRWRRAHSAQARARVSARVSGAVLPRRLPLYAAAVLGGVTFLFLTDFGRDTRGPLPLGHHVGELAVAAGFGLDEVSLSGHHFTPSSDLFAAIDLDGARSVWAADVAAIRQRIEQLPWIASANVVRAGFNGLQVSVTERHPAAVWKSGDNATATHQLVDARGRVLGPVGASAQTGLLLIAGDGAADALPGLIALLGTDPAFKPHVVRATFVSARRWSLTLDSGSVLHLPHERELDALKLATGKLVTGKLAIGKTATDAQDIDVSVPGRIAIRRSVPVSELGKPAFQPDNGS